MQNSRPSERFAGPAPQAFRIFLAARGSALADPMGLRRLEMLGVWKWAVRSGSKSGEPVLASSFRPGPGPGRGASGSSLLLASLSQKPDMADSRPEPSVEPVPAWPRLRRLGGERPGAQSSAIFYFGASEGLGGEMLNAPPGLAERLLIRRRMRARGLPPPLAAAASGARPPLL